MSEQPVGPRDSALLDLQAPTGLPRSAALESITNPISPPERAADILAHFYEGVYDLRAESHLSRLLKVLLGDPGTGAIRKHYTQARLSEALLTTHFMDLDRLYGAIFGFPRLSGETIDVSPYFDTASADKWDEMHERDAAYRARIEQFSKAIPLAGTPAGMAAAASALLGVEVQVYETYLLVDRTGGNPGGAPPAANARTYADVESTYVYYGQMRGTYADIEGGTGTFGRTTTQNRSEFVVRPKRALTLEEHYRLTQVLTRLKPADALLTIDPQGVAVHERITLRGVSADSTHWEVRAKVAPKDSVANVYPNPSPDGKPVAQPRPAFSGYQGEAWSYNSDVKKVTAYALDPDNGKVTVSRNFYRQTLSKTQFVDYTPDKALADPVQIMLGRAASDGVMTTMPYSPERAVAVTR